MDLIKLMILLKTLEILFDNFTKVGSLALLNADILNISGNYKNLSKRLWQLRMVL